MSEGNIVKSLAQDFLNRSLKISLLESDWKVFTWTKQQQFLEATVKSPLLKKYPVNSEFLSLFFKKIINCLELHGLDIHDGIYDSLCSAMLQKTTEKEFYYRHYIIRHPTDNIDDIIVTKETKNIVVNGTTGMRTWEAALMLADWALCNQKVFKNRNVIELGAGVGFTGITIAKHCSAKSIVLTDYNANVLTTIHQNIIINFPHLKPEDKLSGTVYSSDELNIETMMLDWNKIEKVASDVVPDVLIGADIVYDPSVLLPLCKVLQHFIERNRSLEIYIASVLRNEDTFQSFSSLLSSMGFVTEDLDHRPFCITWDSNIDRRFLKIKSNTYTMKL